MKKEKKKTPWEIKIIFVLNYIFSFLFLFLMGTLIKESFGSSAIEGLEIIFMGICLFFSVSFLFAGIGLQKLKSWGRSLSVLTLSIPFIILTYLLLYSKESIISLSGIISIFLTVIIAIEIIYLISNKNLKEILKE